MSLDFMLLVGLWLATTSYYVRDTAINQFKVSYYEKKLELSNVDISKVKNMGFWDIFK